MRTSHPLKLNFVALRSKPRLGVRKVSNKPSTNQRWPVTEWTDEIHAIWALRVPANGYELNLNVPLQLSMEYPENADALRR